MTEEAKPEEAQLEAAKSEGANPEAPEDAKPARKFSWLTALVTLLISAAIGFGAVYVTLGLHDNAAIDNPEGGEKKAAAAPEAASARPNEKMAAFVRKKTPEVLPDITFSDAAGKEMSLSDFKGKAILLNLWATWCAPCREEMPALDRLQQQMGGDTFEVVALSLDRKGVEASQKFLRETEVEHLKLYIDASAKQGTALKIVGMPTTLLIDKEGREIGRLAGPAEWDSEDAKKLIEAALQ